MPDRAAHRVPAWGGAADRRSVELLCSFVDKEHRRQVMRGGRIHVKAPSGLTYTLPGLDGSIVWVRREGKLLGYLCVASGKELPWADNILALLLTARYDEGALWVAGNWTSHYGPVPGEAVRLLAGRSRAGWWHRICQWARGW
jgi:hypothetical protein